MIVGGPLARLSIAAVPFATEHLAADRRALRVRGGRGVPRHGTGRDGRRRGGGRGGTAVAVFSMCADIGAIVGPLVAGLLADTSSYPAAFGVGAALMIGGALLAGGCREVGARSADQEEAR